MTSLADAGGRLQQRRYISVRAKFCIALAAVIAWMLFSIIVSRPWMEALAAATHPLFALWAISFIAYIREPGEFDYYSPRWYAEVLPVPQIRRFVGGWQLLGAAGYGAQRASGSGWRSSRYLNARVTSPAFRKDWALTGGLLYTNTPVSTGFTYRYLQLNLGVTRAF